MKLSKGIISREEAMKLAPDYVTFIESKTLKGWDSVDKQFQTVKKGQKALTYNDGDFVLVTISSVNRNDPRAEDGPIVRVSNGEYSWRVDGDKCAWILKG